MITFYIQFFIFLDILLISEEKRNFIKKLNDWFLKIIFNLRLKKGRIFFVVTIKVCFFFLSKHDLWRKDKIWRNNSQCEWQKVSLDYFKLPGFIFSDVSQCDKDLNIVLAKVLMMFSKLKDKSSMRPPYADIRILFYFFSERTQS